MQKLFFKKSLNWIIKILWVYVAEGCICERLQLSLTPAEAGESYSIGGTAS